MTVVRPVRFVALGDSLTEGVGDPVGDGLRGWAALLADGLGPAVEFRDLAVSGRRPVRCWSGSFRSLWGCGRTSCRF